MNWTEALPVRPGCGGAAAGAARGSARPGRRRGRRGWSVAAALLLSPARAGCARGAPRRRRRPLTSGPPEPQPCSAGPARRERPDSAAPVPRAGRSRPGAAPSGVGAVRCGPVPPGRAQPTLIPVPRAAGLPRPGLWCCIFRSGVCGPWAVPGAGARSPPGPGERRLCSGALRAQPSHAPERECSQCFQEKDRAINCRAIYFQGSCAI